MSNNEILEALGNYAQTGNCFTRQTSDLLRKFKNNGGTKDAVKAYLDILSSKNKDNQQLQAGIEDILDILSNWCVPEMRVW